MKYISEIYQKNKKILSKICFPVILFFYPFLTVNQGVDVSDSLYSMTNFLFFPELEGMWIVSTYLSNVVGYLLTCLPYGTTVLGMNCYTGLFVSGNAIFTYRILKKWMPAWIAFLGEIIAISFCWIPTGILYNYLTYLLLTIGLLTLYKGLVEENEKYLIIAGVALGLNVFVRIPNLTEMALIVGLWYYLAMKKKPMAEIIKKTSYCILGYLIGMTLPLLGIGIKYGFSGIYEMIRDLGNIGDQDATYSMGAMILRIFQAYLQSIGWAALLCIGVFMGTMMFLCGKGKWKKSKKILYIIGILVLLRFFWGRGMFTFRYYEDYTSMYEWGMMGLYLSWISIAFLLLSQRSSLEEKLWAVLAAIVLLITPLGSNNYTYQNLNNLFFIAPFTTYTCVKMLRRKERKRFADQISFPWKAMVITLGAMILIQGLGFHVNFVFRDGMDGQKREYKFSTPASVAGMKTTGENGEKLQSLLNYLKPISGGKKLILFGDCPGICFLTGSAPAIHTAWPDLESENYEKIKRQLENIQGRPLVVIKEKEYNTEQGKEKKKLIEKFLEKENYILTYNDRGYQVYE